MGLMTSKRLAELEAKIGKLRDTGGVAVPAGSVDATEMASGILDGTQQKEVADANVVGGVPVVHRIALASGADADVDVALTHKTRILDAVIVLKGAGTTGSDVTIKNVTTAISDVIDVSGGGDKAVFRPSTIDDAQHEVGAGDNLRVSFTSTGGDFPGAEVHIFGVRVA